MGTRLPSAEEVLIIRPAGKTGQPPHRSNQVIPSLPESLPGRPGIPKQDPNAMRSSRNVVAAELYEYDSQ
jgi:hypothetical protein